MKLVSLWRGPGLAYGPSGKTACGVEITCRYYGTGLYGMEESGQVWALAIDHSVNVPGNPHHPRAHKWIPILSETAVLDR